MFFVIRLDSDFFIEWNAQATFFLHEIIHMLSVKVSYRFNNDFKVAQNSFKHVDFDGSL